jgi:hypothetical protein
VRKVHELELVPERRTQEPERSYIYPLFRNYLSSYYPRYWSVVKVDAEMDADDRAVAVAVGLGPAKTLATTENSKSLLRVEYTSSPVLEAEVEEDGSASEPEVE